MVNLLESIHTSSKQRDHVYQRYSQTSWTNRKVETYKLCPHCQKELNFKRYKEHKRLYFNDDTKQWLKEELNLRANVSESSSDFSCLDEGDLSKDVHHSPEDDWMLSTDLDYLSQHSPNVDPEHQSIPDSDHLQGM